MDEQSNSSINISKNVVSGSLLGTDSTIASNNAVWVNPYTTQSNTGVINNSLTGTLCDPNIIGNSTTGTTVSTSNGTSYMWPPSYPPSNVFTFHTPDGKEIQFVYETDDFGNSFLALRLAPKKNCKHKVKLFDGIYLYTPNKRPNIFRRIFHALFLGWKWESTLEENFIESL